MSNFDITGIQDFRGLYKEMVGAFLEKGLEGELEEELGYSKYDHGNKETSNSRNGHTTKSLKTGNGVLELKVPRDRDGEFEPRLVKKRQSSLTQEIAEMERHPQRLVSDSGATGNLFPGQVTGIGT